MYVCIYVWTVIPADKHFAMIVRPESCSESLRGPFSCAVILVTGCMLPPATHLS